MMKWPEKVWEPGDFRNNKQLWYSRAVTPEDRARRREVERKVFRMHSDVSVISEQTEIK